MILKKFINHVNIAEAWRPAGNECFLMIIKICISSIIYIDDLYGKF